MGKQCCAGCGERFEARRNVLQQRFCSKPECQRTRRARWQREKMAQDADYRANQAQAGRRWRERHPQYWREYRRTHPEYTAHNRARQRHRNRRQREPSRGFATIAKIRPPDLWDCKMTSVSKNSGKAAELDGRWKGGRQRLASCEPVESSAAVNPKPIHKPDVSSYREKSSRFG